MKNFDVIIIGAGSIGVPTAMALGEKGFKVAVIEKNCDVGQGMNGRAIGGIRATHTIKSKIITCLESIKIFSTWEKKHGNNIGWFKGGYCFPVYEKEHKEILKSHINLQKKFGLKISWVQPKKINKIVPGIIDENLLGGTYAPDDGRCLPSMSIKAFYKYAVALGVEFKFNEKLEKIILNGNKIKEIKTNKNKYKTTWLVNATGAFASKIGELIKMTFPIYNDPHVAGKTGAIENKFDPLIIDLRSINSSERFYFYQNKANEIIFTIKPSNKFNKLINIVDFFKERTTILLPHIKNINILNSWKGVYPTTPDGIPIIGKINEIEGFINTIGMGGQGVMLGPGVGKLITRLISNKLNSIDKQILDEFSLYRDFKEKEYLR